MKKKNLMMVACLAALGLPLQAQVVATLGFEAGDEKFVHKDSVQFASFYADHINLYGGDVWNEKCTEAHSGEYALELNNSNVYKGNTWDRGLKLRYLNIEEETSYRVSFWVKAAPTYTLESDPATNLNTSIKSTLSIGRENLEAPLMSQSGKQYYYNWTQGMTGQWRRLSFVAYNSGKAIQDNFFDQFDDNIKEIIVNDPDDPSKNDTIWWKGDETSFPDTYFLTINMYNPGRYVLDDIMVEKATMAGCYYNYDFIKADLGYPTNIAELAKASTDPRGILLLDKSCVKVTKGGTELEVMSVEGHDDGGLYIFMAESDALESGAEDVRVSFTPPADCPIVYNTDQRPSMDVESEMKVLGFADEAIWPDESLDESPYTWLEPNMLSCNPESGSFELDPATFNQVTVTYDRQLDLNTASVVLKDGNGTSTVDLSSDVSLSEDLMSVIVPVGNLANGEYTLTLSGVANIYGIPTLEDQVIKFGVGPDNDTSVSEVVYAPDFTKVEDGTFPKGWVADCVEYIHEYGVEEDGKVWNYNYGGNKGGGGPRMFTGFSGDFTHALYWGTRGVADETQKGTLTYGEQVKNFMLPEGGLDPEMDPEIALWLEPKKHEVSFRMAAWKGEPVFNFTLEDLEGNVVARFDNITAVPNIKGEENGRKVSGSVEMRTDFTVPAAGYYMLKFSTTPGATWQELLLANVRLITKPSDAAYNKQLLREACDSAAVVLGNVENAVYDGTTKTALADAVKEANETHFTSPTAINDMCSRLYGLCGDMLLRMKNVDDFDLSLAELQAAMSNYVGTKYVMADDYIAAEKLVDDYATVSPTTLDDATLNEVAPKLVRYAGLVNNLGTCIDALTYRAYKAALTARMLGTDAEGAITAAENAIDDDDDVVAAVNEANKWTIYKILGETGTIADELKTTIMSETEDDGEGNMLVATSGVDFTGYIKNPHFYTFATDNKADATSESVPGWNFDGSVHLRDGDFIASETKPVVSSVLNGYKSEYTVSQSVSGLPVGIYDVFLRTRTAAGKNGVNDETGRPDKYLWVSTAEGDTIFTAFAEGLSWNGLPTVIKNVKVEENTVLAFGATEHYTSGKNVNGEGVDQGSWDTNTFVDEAHLFLVAPLEGFDYTGALTGVDEVKAAEAVSYEYFTVDGMKLDRPVKGVNIVKIHRADGTTDVKKVVVK